MAFLFFQEPQVYRTALNEACHRWREWRSLQQWAKDTYAKLSSQYAHRRIDPVPIDDGAPAGSSVSFFTRRSTRNGRDAGVRAWVVWQIMLWLHQPDLKFRRIPSENDIVRFVEFLYNAWEPDRGSETYLNPGTARNYLHAVGELYLTLAGVNIFQQLVDAQGNLLTGVDWDK